MHREVRKTGFSDVVLHAIVRILENKGFVSHKAYGRTYEYFPAVAKEDYTNSYMKNVLNNFFDGSVSRMVNFFSAQKSISLKETDEILCPSHAGFSSKALTFTHLHCTLMSALRYIIEVIVCSGLFMVFYRWLLAGKVSFWICRAYIMVTMALALIIPMMNIPVYTVAPVTESLLETFVMEGIESPDEAMGTYAEADGKIVDIHDGYRSLVEFRPAIIELLKPCTKIKEEPGITIYDCGNGTIATMGYKVEGCDHFTSNAKGTGKGLNVTIEHADGSRTTYAHLSRIS